MEKTIGYFAFGGMLVGAMFGLIWTGGSNPLIGIASGAIAGVFIGWFIAAAMLELRKKNK